VKKVKPITNNVVLNIEYILKVTKAWSGLALLVLCARAWGLGGGGGVVCSFFFVF
tara:strand:- start:248 stop:412 length:165 start_codon:yes stop_codon:yes gene_type:complete